MNNCPTYTSAAVNELVCAFESLPSWEKRYFYLIELGKQLPSLASDENQALHFNGCQSSVWLTTSLQTQEDAPRLHFLADSDSKIVRGLIAVLHRVYSGQTPDFILNYDIDALFEQLALEQHINAGRRNGLHAMEMHIKGIARSYTA